MKKVFGKAAVPLSMAVRAGDYVYISGQVPVVDGKVVEGGIEPRPLRSWTMSPPFWKRQAVQ